MVTSWVDTAAVKHPDRVAIESDGRMITYAELGRSAWAGAGGEEPVTLEPEDRFELVDWLTPAPEQAVAPMREPFVAAFRGHAGPGSRDLAEKAWEAWQDALLAGQGIDHALYRAEAGVIGKGSGAPVYARLWLSPWQLRRAAWSASRAARDAA